MIICIVLALRVIIRSLTTDALFRAVKLKILTMVRVKTAITVILNFQLIRTGAGRIAHSGTLKLDQIVFLNMNLLSFISK